MAETTSLTIAIDFDKTWTADPEAFRLIAQLLRSRGHQIIIATRRDKWCDDMQRHNLLTSLPVIYCGPTFKEEACRKAGYKVDIWIDDMPGTIQRTAILADQPL